MEIWINPECSKCHTALTTLEESDTTYTVRRYLEDPPTATEITDVLDRLGLQPWDITRTNEPAAHDAGLTTLGRTSANRDAWIAALAQHPILIQRPIITTDDGTAIIARDEKSLHQAIHSKPPADNA